MKLWIWTLLVQAAMTASAQEVPIPKGNGCKGQYVLSRNHTRIEVKSMGVETKPECDTIQYIFKLDTALPDVEIECRWDFDFYIQGVDYCARNTSGSRFAIDRSAPLAKTYKGQNDFSLAVGKFLSIIGNAKKAVKAQPGLEADFLTITKQIERYIYRSKSIRLTYPSPLEFLSHTRTLQVEIEKFPYEKLTGLAPTEKVMVCDNNGSSRLWIFDPSTPVNVATTESQSRLVLSNRYYALGAQRAGRHDYAAIMDAVHDMPDADKINCQSPAAFQLTDKDFGFLPPAHCELMTSVALNQWLGGSPRLLSVGDYENEFYCQSGM